MKKYIMALDAGTTSTRAILFDEEGESIFKAQKEFPQYYPKPGYVEHHPNEIWQSQLAVARECLEKSGIPSASLLAIGITNQRESTIVWDRKTGQAIYPAIVWQCRRTTEWIKEAQKSHLEISEKIREKTGLVFDPYFSATKIRWILDHVEGAQERAEAGELCFGTVDTWLMYKLSKGNCFVTDYTNASRTLLFNIHSLEWDEELLSFFRIPRAMLPKVNPSSGFFGEVDPEFLGRPVPICGVAGDQQAALFGQCCFQKGDVKNTYGTGCFMLMNTGNQAILSKHGLLSTIAWGIDGKVQYALEGSVYVGGAVIQWLRDELHMLDKAEDSEYFASKVEDSNGCYIVPAFTGLGAPYWDPFARGSITGLTRGVNKNHIIRAALESIAFQSRDLLLAMEQDMGQRLRSLRVDGGASGNNFLMQFQADLMQASVIRSHSIETTALGAAYLAGLSVGLYESMESLEERHHVEMEFFPKMTREKREEKVRGWKKALEASFGFGKED